jgi:hypothetical protein
MSVGITKRVRILALARHWPECPKGGDVSDWLAAGHTREELDRLIDGAPEVTNIKDINFKDPPIGAGDPLAPDPKPLDPDEDPKPESDTLTGLNNKYCVVRDGGKTRVLSFEDHSQQIGRRQHIRCVATFTSFEDFKNYYCNQWVQVDEKTSMPLGKWWLSNPERRQYEGIVFDPSGPGVVGGRLNLWRGWGVEPKSGDWSLMRQHIHQVLANGNQEHFEYIMNWLAWTVQNPARRAEVAIVFRGARGSGKGTLGNTLCHIFGQHAVHISSSDHLAGRFNAHLRDACFLFADEAYWPGDKSAEGSLKRLITEPELFIEPKGREAVTTPNMLHVLMASNENWIVPAGEKERRFAVFDVPDHKAQDDKWFGPLYAQLEDGGYEAMLFDLLRHNLGDWRASTSPPLRSRS